MGCDKEFGGKGFVEKKFVVKESICIVSLVFVGKGEFRRPGVSGGQDLWRPGFQEARSFRRPGGSPRIGQ